jgi:hypothetical protein
MRKSFLLLITALLVMVGCGPAAVEISWSDDLSNIMSYYEDINSLDDVKPGDTFTVTLPADGDATWTIYGTEIYTSDSEIGTAAVHAGLIDAASGGTVTVEYVAGQDSYTSTEANGITSEDYGSWDHSYKFVK